MGLKLLDCVEQMDWFDGSFLMGCCTRGSGKDEPQNAVNFEPAVTKDSKNKLLGGQSSKQDDPSSVSINTVGKCRICEFDEVDGSFSFKSVRAASEHQFGLVPLRRMSHHLLCSL